MAVNVSGGALTFEALVASGQFQAQINNIEKSLQGLTRTAEQEARSIDNLVAKTTSAIAAYASLASASNFVGDIARVRGEFQQLEVAFKTMLGSKAEADALLAQVTEFAASTPFELKDIAQATKSLLAFNVQAKDVEPTLRALGDISAGIGAPIKEIADLYGKAKVQGRLFQEDINQLTGRGIPIIQELAKQFGVTEDKVRSLVESGKVGFPNLEQAFKDLTSEGSKFGGLMAAQADTIAGLQSNLTDAITRMLNDIGEANEDFIADTIRGAISLVENYETVVDVLKVLAITFGTYKAAVIAHNVVTAISTSLTKGWTIAEMLHLAAMRASTVAMRILNATMLANPYVAVATGIAALVSAMIIFKKETTQVKTAQELTAKATEDLGNRLSEARAKFEPYLQQLRETNLSEQDRVRIYNEILKVDPKVLAGITAKTLSYDNLKRGVDGYLTSLRNQIRLETNKEALVSSIKIEDSISDQLEDAKKNLDKVDKIIAGIRKTGGQAAQALDGLERSRDAMAKKVATLTNELKKQQEVTEEINKKGNSLKVDAPTPPGITQTNKQLIDAVNSITELGELRKKIEADYQAATDKQKRESLASDLKYADARKKALDVYGSAIQGAKDLRREENKLQDLFEKRKGILEAIEGLKRGSDQSGLLKEQSEIDKVNEKYDNAIQKVVDYNTEVEKLGKGQKIGAIEISTIEAARSVELSNVDLRKQAEIQKQNLEEQKVIFERYEEAKKEFGIQKANEMFSEQTKGFDNYAQVLLSEFQKLQPKILLGIGNIKDKEMFSFLLKAMKDVGQQVVNQQQQEYKALIAASLSYNDKKAALDYKYQELFKTLKDQRVKMSEEEYSARLEALQKAQEEERAILEIQRVRTSDFYKNLNKDLFLQTREQLKARAEGLKQALRDGQFEVDVNGAQIITPQMKSEIESAIAATEQLLDNTNETAISAAKFNKESAKVRNALQAAAGLASQFDSELGDALSTMANMADAAMDISTSVGQFASGDILSGIGSAISGIAKLASSIFGNAAAEKRKKEVEEFNNRVYTGEFEINRLYRERELSQIRINKLRLEGIEAERKLLEEQKLSIESDYDSLFQELTNTTVQVLGKQLGGGIGDLSQELLQNFLDSGGTLDEFREKFAGFNDLVVDVKLSGLSYEQLEDLFIKGQLQGRAKELFETLQSLKQQGLDVDKALADAKREAQEIFTGTTSDSIVDSIVDGFQKGLSSATDFASTFEDLMKKAVLNSLKFKYLEGPLKKFFEDFAEASESNGNLTNAEIDSLNNQFNSIINTANQQFQQLQQLSGLDFLNQAEDNNSLKGAIKGMTEQTAEVLAGQLGGLRLNAADQLSVARQGLAVLQNIELNTAKAYLELVKTNGYWEGVTTGTKRLFID
jgi:tape measure domain-containing protein